MSVEINISDISEGPNVEGERLVARICEEIGQFERIFEVGGKQHANALLNVRDGEGSFYNVTSDVKDELVDLASGQCKEIMKNLKIYSNYPEEPYLKLV